MSASNSLSPPRQDELEVSLFGPGYGESVLLHLGHDDWAIIDSCIDETSNAPLPIRYLQRMGVDPTRAVKLLVTSHWHDDHIRGLASVVRECQNAQLCCSTALRASEFLTLVHALGEHSMMASSGVQEFYNVLQELKQRAQAGFGPSHPIWAIESRVLWNRSSSPGVLAGQVTALSPSDSAITLSLQHLSNLIPSQGSRKRRIAAQTPNHTAVVLWVRVGNVSILLGADLEETSDPGTGWTVIVDSETRPPGRASVLKVPHHGSVTADYPPVWSEMLSDRPVAILTPFMRGRNRLPTDPDIQRLCGRTTEVYLTAPPTEKRKKRSGPVERMIRETVRSIRQVHGFTGLVRLHLRIKQKDGQPRWTTELFEHALLACQ